MGKYVTVKSCDILLTEQWTFSWFAESSYFQFCPDTAIFWGWLSLQLLLVSTDLELVVLWHRWLWEWYEGPVPFLLLISSNYGSKKILFFPTGKRQMYPSFLFIPFQWYLKRNSVLCSKVTVDCYCFVKF